MSESTATRAISSSGSSSGRQSRKKVRFSSSFAAAKGRHKRTAPKSSTKKARNGRGRRRNMARILMRQRAGGNRAQSTNPTHLSPPPPLGAEELEEVGGSAGTIFPAIAERP